MFGAAVWWLPALCNMAICCNATNLIKISVAAPGLPFGSRTACSTLPQSFITDTAAFNSDNVANDNSAATSMTVSIQGSPVPNRRLFSPNRSVNVRTRTPPVTSRLTSPSPVRRSVSRDSAAACARPAYHVALPR